MSNLLDILGCSDIRLMPERIMDIITGDKAVRDDIYRELIKAHGGDMSYEWFATIYESDLSERKQKKQDFTPAGPADIAAMLCETEGIIHEPTAGNKILVEHGTKEIAVGFQASHLHYQLLGTLGEVCTDPTVEPVYPGDYGGSIPWGCFGKSGESPLCSHQ